MGYWQSCIGDATRGYCVCALLATQIPVLPHEAVVEVLTHFRTLSALPTSVLERGSKQGTFMPYGNARSEAEAFMATVYGAMLSARACGDPEMFGVITLPLIDRLVIK
jgi:TetR/AcrR family transcriptional repressor of nem operon